MYDSEDFIKLINPTPSKCPDLDIIDVLNGGVWIIDGKKWEEQGHVFEYDFVDDTVTQEKTFVFVDTDIGMVRKDVFIDFSLYIFVFTAKKLVRLNTDTVPTAKEVKNMGYYATSRRGNRIGALCDCIDRIINNNEEIKGISKVSPDPRNYMRTYSPQKKYYGKCLMYNITNLNGGGDYCNE